MRIGVSIEKHRVSMVLIDSHGLIQRKRERFFETFETNMMEAVTMTLKDLLEGFTVGKGFMVHDGIYIGTDFVRYFIESERHLSKVGLIRLAGHQPDIVPPCFDWTKSRFDKYFRGYETVDGGCEFTGRVITEVNEESLKKAAQKLIDNGAEVIVLCGAFSIFYPDQESDAVAYLKKHFSQPILCSYHSQTHGFIERENMSLLNGLIYPAFWKAMDEIEEIFCMQGIDCPMLFGRNDGTTFNKEDTVPFPFRTLDSAITNALVGTARLTLSREAFVINMDDDTLRIGIMKNGVLFPSIHPQKKNDYMGEIYYHTIPVGLDSPLTINSQGIKIHDITTETPAKIYKYTLRDALLIYSAREGSLALDVMTAYRCVEKIEEHLINYYMTLRCEGVDHPLILGGIASSLFGYNAQIIVPNSSDFSSAYGAATSNISYCHMRIAQLPSNSQDSRNKLTNFKAETMELARYRGAHNPEIIREKIERYRYVSGDWYNLELTVSGRHRNELKLVC